MIKDIIKLARELEEHLCVYYEDFGSLENIINHPLIGKEEIDDEEISMAERELTIRTKLKEAIADFEHDYGVVL